MNPKPAPLPDDEAEAHDRRAGPRYISVLRVGRGEWEGQDQLCVVRNMSPGGLMFECLRPPAMGQHVRIELRSDKIMTGFVRWVSACQVGIEFDAPVVVEHILKEDRPSLLRVRPRLPRFVRKGTMRLIGEGEPVLAEIVDIASSGAQCRIDQPMRRGEPIVAALDGVAVTNAEIRWVQGDLVGVRFEKPLPWRSFQQWLDQAPR